MFTNQNMFKKQEYIFAVTSNFWGVLSIESNPDSKTNYIFKTFVCLNFTATMP